MSLAALTLSAGFALLALLGIPFAFALVGVVIAVVTLEGMEPAFVAQQMLAGSQMFSLLAIPLFMLASELMTAGGMSKRLVAIANALVGHRRGGLAMVAVLAGLFFSSISGSAPATTAAIGGIMIPAMVAGGYSLPFAASIAVASGVLGPLIPPSITFVIWGTIAEQSITRLFLAGIMPGITIAVGLMALCWVHAYRANISRAPRASWHDLALALWEGKLALLSPFIILGGIYGGVFTPTEAAAVSCLYALIVGVLVERNMSLSAIPAIVMASVRTSALVTAIIAASAGFGVLIAQERIASDLAAWLAQNIDNKYIMLAGLNVVFFLLAAVMDEIAIMVIFGPMLIQIANQFGLDPIHFGAIIVTNVAIGMASPPVGYCLFVGMAISGLSLGKMAKAMIPSIALMFFVLMLVTYFPWFSLFFQ